MPRNPFPLPNRLGPIFTSAQARAVGLNAGRLRCADVVKLAAGVYARRESLGLEEARSQAMPTGAPPHPNEVARRETVAYATALSQQLPAGAFFMGSTAAAIWGLPFRAAPGQADNAAAAPLEIGVMRGGRSRAAPGIRYRAIAASQVRVTHARVGACRHDDLIPVTDVATTWAMVAPGLSRWDAVALGDAAIRHPRYPGTSEHKRDPLATLADLERAASTRFRRGRARLEELLLWLSSQAASPPESHIRVLLREWGAPEPTLDFDVWAHSGELLGASEIAFPKFKIAVEYEGAHHFSQAGQYARDTQKYQRYAAEGWLVIRVTKVMLYREPDDLVRTVFNALSARGWRG